MPAKKKDNAIGEKLLGVLLATGGGFGVTFGMNQLDTRIDTFKKNPVLSPLVGEAVAITTLFTTPEGWHPLAYGMMGAVGSDFANDLVNGLSRIEIDNSMNQDDMDDMEEGGYGDSREGGENNNDDEEEVNRDRPIQDSDFPDHPDYVDSGDGTG